MTNNIKTWPERIWLQHGVEDAVPDFRECDGITWEREDIHGNDVAYVRADLGGHIAGAGKLVESTATNECKDGGQCSTGGYCEDCPDKSAGWVDVNNKLGPIGEDLLIALSTGKVVVGIRWSGNAWHWEETDDDEDLDAHVTHWAVFPRPPKAAP